MSEMGLVLRTLGSTTAKYWSLILAFLFPCAGWLLLGLAWWEALLVLAGMAVVMAAERLLQHRRLRHLEDATNRLAEGDLLVEIPDAAGSGRNLPTALERLRQSLISADTLAAEVLAEKEASQFAEEAMDYFAHRFEREAKESIDKFAEVASALAETASILSQEVAASNQSSEVMARSTTDMSRDFDGVAVVSSQVSSTSREASEHLTTSTGAVDTAAGRMDELMEAMSRLSGLTDQVGTFVEIVDTIAAKTRMLALNATIEAARAGTSGRGFAVVAEEVKTLAAQTADATADISDRLTAINGAVAAALDQAQSVSGEIRSSSTRAMEAAGLVGQQMDAITEIDSRMKNALTGANQVSGSVESLVRCLERMDTVSGQIGQSVEALRDSSAQLSRRVGRFLDGQEQGVVHVGILHSLSGTMVASERPLKEALIMFIKEQNRNGGLLGRRIVPVIANPRSDPDLYGTLARSMIDEKQVAAIFGCWTSSSRKAVLPQVEATRTLLFYPTQYEGQEQSPYIYYFGATPNQQALVATDHLMSAAGGGYRQFYLIGTDYIYPQTANAILQAHLAAKGIPERHRPQILTPFSHKDWAGTVRNLKSFARTGPTAVISTINGDANVYFFRELARQGIAAEDIPVMSLSIGEADAATIGPSYLQGHCAAWCYFQSLPAPANQAFIRQWREHTGDPQAVTTDPMEAHFLAFRLWCAAVEKAGTFEVEAVKAALDGAPADSLSGVPVFLDPENHHIHRPSLIGRFEADGTLEIVRQSDRLIEPAPWSPYLDAPAMAQAAE